MENQFLDLRLAQQMMRARTTLRNFQMHPVVRRESYSRDLNPAVVALCEKLSSLEHAESSIVTSFGLGAVLSLCFAHLKPGDHILVAEAFLQHQPQLIRTMKTYGVDASVIEDDLDAWRSGVCSTTRMAFVAPEPTTVTSGQCQQIRIQAIRRALEEAGHDGQKIHLAVDNSLCTGRQVQPLRYGADFVLYTSTRTLEQNDRVVAGAVCGCKALMKSVAKCMSDAKVCVSPFNAWVILRGLGGESAQVLDHILGVGSKGGNGKVVELTNSLP